MDWFVIIAGFAVICVNCGLTRSGLYLDAKDNIALALKLAEKSTAKAQRVAIARAWANTPRIILANEPTAALDSKRGGIVMDLLRKIAAEQDACIIAVTHDEKIYDRFDRLFHLRDGRLENA